MLVGGQTTVKYAMAANSAEKKFCPLRRTTLVLAFRSFASLASHTLRRLCLRAEEVVQVYGFCIRTLHLPVISVMIIGVMRLSYNERAVPDGTFRHHLF